MRKLHVIFIALLIHGGGIFSQSNISFLDEELIKENRINTVTEWNHAYTGREASDDGRISLRASYDNNGYLQEEITFNSNGEKSRKVTSRFDSMGNRTEHIVFDSRNNRTTFSQMATFDQQGNKIVEWGFDGLGDYLNKYHLDPDGRLREIHYTSQGNLREKRVFTYTGNETDVSVILSDNTISEKIKLIYNSMGYLIQEAYFDNKETLLRKIEYTYDGSGQKTGERRYHKSQMQYRYVYLYENGLLSKIIRNDRQGRETVTNKYYYNENRQLLREAWFNENADDYSTRGFTWDSRGNIVSVETYYATYNYQVLYRYDYSFF
jgi:YD repeat-containing protein